MIIDWICGHNIKSPRCANTGGLDSSFHLPKIAGTILSKFLKNHFINSITIVIIMVFK